GVVSTARVQKGGAAIKSSPENHFTPGPHCRVTGSASGCASGAGGRPTVGAGGVSAAGVPIAAIVISAPDAHFAASPNSCVKVSGLGRIGRAGGYPAIGAGIVSPSGVQK